MKTKRFFMVLPAMAALLLTVSCNNQEFETSEVSDTHTIPFKVTVDQGIQTRATLSSDGKDYVFEAGDKLFVYDNPSSPKVKCTLTLKSGDEGKTTGVTFEGDLTYTGDVPAPETELTAVLKGANDGNSVIPATIEGYLTSGISYPTTAIASSLAEAVQKYSYFEGTTTFGERKFKLDQKATFVDFDITLEDGTAAGTGLGVTINNSGSAVRTGTVTTVADESGTIKAKFTAAFPGGEVTLSSANVTLSDNTANTKARASFGGTEGLVSNKIYRVQKTIEKQYMVSASYSSITGTLVEYQDLEYTTSLQTVMTNVGVPSSLREQVKGCSLKEGDSISIGTFNGDTKDCTLVALKEGQSTATITTTNSFFPSFDLIITVERQR